jgi:hypothetical protein
MGFDRLSNFIIKNFNYKYNFIIDDMKRKFLGNHVLFDLNFLIYNQMFQLEEEINDIIKIVLNLPFSYTVNNKTDERLQKIFDLPWWKTHCENIEFIFDGDLEDDIIHKFINFITSKQEKGINKIDLMIIDRIINSIEEYIFEFHIKKNINTIGIFIDGIPSYSKILEQRRRRMKNYYESIVRKEKFNTYFGTIKNIYMDDNGIKFNYFKWIEKRFSLDKSFSPISPIIKNLEVEIEKFFKNKYPNITLFIDSGANNGESDLKIFQYIQKNNLLGDVVIHTTDSDLIHLMLVQQTYYFLKRIEINISILKHNSRDDENINYYDGPGMINCIIKLNNEINNTDKFDYRLIYDFCFLLFLFGNDHLPSSLEFGPEIGIDFIFTTLNKNKTHLINLNDDKIIVNLSSVKNFFQSINKNIKNINAKILIIRNFKLTINLINTLTDSDKLNLDYNSIIELIKNLLYKDAIKNKEKLDESDIRFHVLQHHQLTWDKYTKNQVELINSISEQLLDNLDYSSLENVGLYSYVKPYLKTNDNYQDLYNILSESTITDLNNKNKNLFEPSFNPTKEDYIKKAEESYNHTMCYDYIKKIYHLSTSFFGNLITYHTNNITTYSYDRVPKIEHIIKYLNENEDENKWLKEIGEENIINNNYFNSINHHVFITPYLSIDNVKEATIKHTIQSLEVKNLWLNKNENDKEEFKYNDVDVKEFLTEWNNVSKESETPMIINPNDFNLI